MLNNIVSCCNSSMRQACKECQGRERERGAGRPVKEAMEAFSERLSDWAFHQSLSLAPMICRLSSAAAGASL